jgi:hypothetical protein
MPRKKEYRRLLRIAIPVNYDEIKEVRKLAKAQRMPVSVYVRSVIFAPKGNTDGTL